MGKHLTKRNFFRSLIDAEEPTSREIAESYFPSLSVEDKVQYQDWLSLHFNQYSSHTFLPSDGDTGLGAAVFWNIDGDDITFAVAVRATSWVGFGISEAGGMLGSDVALFRASQSDTLVDSYILESRSDPLTDDSQDWTLLSSETIDGWIIVEMTRKLDTGDNQGA